MLLVYSGRAKTCFKSIPEERTLACFSHHHLPYIPEERTRVLN